MLSLFIGIYLSSSNDFIYKSNFLFIFLISGFLLLCVKVLKFLIFFLTISNKLFLSIKDKHILSSNNSLNSIFSLLFC